MSRLPTIENQERQPYPSDLSDAEWVILKPLLPAPKGFGHPVEVDLREILNGIFYVQPWDVSGKCCPMTCLPTPPCMATFRNGNVEASGRFFTIRCVINCELSARAR